MTIMEKQIKQFLDFLQNEKEYHLTHYNHIVEIFINSRIT